MNCYDWAAVAIGGWTGLAACLALALGKINAAMKPCKSSSRTEASA